MLSCRSQSFHATLKSVGICNSMSRLDMRTLSWDPTVRSDAAAKSKAAGTFERQESQRTRTDLLCIFSKRQGPKCETSPNFTWFRPLCRPLLRRRGPCAVQFRVLGLSVRVPARPDTGRLLCSMPAGTGFSHHKPGRYLDLDTSNTRCLSKSLIRTFLDMTGSGPVVVVVEGRLVLVVFRPTSSLVIYSACRPCRAQG